MEIGSFIELQLPKGLEYRRGERDIARLNSGRAAVFHAFRVTGCNAIWLPYYQCDTVRDFLLRKGCCVKYYHIDEAFNPVNLYPADNEAVLLVNYYGIMSFSRMEKLAGQFKNAIIDNSQAFFAEPIINTLSIYSARKFVGVPDGAYVIGPHAERFWEEYPQGYSSDTAAFLLQRIEYGCEGKAYASRSENEHRIDTEDIAKMSGLTRTLLDGTDYDAAAKPRRENFRYAHSILGGINKINPLLYYDNTCIPMVYPLLAEDDTLLDRLLQNKHFQGHWWSYLLEEMPEDCFEYYLSRYMIPITIDQRYGKEEIDFIGSIVNG